MMKLTLLTITSLLATLILVGAQGITIKDDVNYKNPVRTADEDEIKNLPGLNDPVSFRQFSGYLKAHEKGSLTKKFLHYWFVESQSNSTADPILLWLNGGPGCSSMGGLFTELGPFQVNEGGKTLSLNEYSWNKYANVLFLESPSDVGFSYSDSLFDVKTDDSTAKENYNAIKNFLQKYPQYKSNPLYLSGESYAGVYLPTLGELIDHDHELNLKGIAIGNGYLDANKLNDALVLFAYYHGLVGKSDWSRLSDKCCDGKPPSRESCIFSGKHSKFGCDFAVNSVLNVLNQAGINPYNLYGKCLDSSSSKLLARALRNRSGLSRERVDKAMREMTYRVDLNSTRDDKPFRVFDAKKMIGDEPPCFDEHNLIKYLNDKSVRDAIHIPKQVGKWDVCSAIPYIVKYPTREGGLAPQMKELINSKRNLTLLVYNGDVDTVCNFLGDEWFVDDLGRKVISPYHFWKVNNQIAGFVKHYDGITFATVRGSGHMVPGDKPQEALAMIKIFLDAKRKNVEL